MSVRTDGYVYCLWDGINKICRIGMTALDAKGRIEGQVSHYPLPLEINKIFCHHVLDVEGYLHHLFKEFKVKNSWYRITPKMFFYQMKLLKSAKNLEHMPWADDHESRETRRWILTVNGREHVIIRTFRDGHYSRIKFKNKDDRSFYIKLPCGIRIDDIKCYCVETDVKISNFSRTRELSAKLEFRLCEKGDQLVVKYCEMIRLKKLNKLKKYRNSAVEKVIKKAETQKPVMI